MLRKSSKLSKNGCHARGLALQNWGLNVVPRHTPLNWACRLRFGFHRPKKGTESATRAAGRFAGFCSYRQKRLEIHNKADPDEKKNSKEVTVCLKMCTHLQKKMTVDSY